MTHGNFRHGMKCTPEYRAWQNMHTRCRNPNYSEWHRYGGRGIKVCGRWSDFRIFLADVGHRPTQKHLLDRINNDGDYEPGNVRWTDIYGSARNRRSVRLYTIDGVTKTLPEWCVDKTRRKVAWRRLRDGWPIEDAILLPPQSTKKHTSGVRHDAH